jgi:hypothetical protein
MPGFGLRVSASGRKSWIAMYRHEGVMRRMTIGTCPPLNLADAREIADDILRDATAFTKSKPARATESFSQGYIWIPDAIDQIGEALHSGEWTCAEWRVRQLPPLSGDERDAESLDRGGISEEKYCAERLAHARFCRVTSWLRTQLAMWHLRKEASIPGGTYAMPPGFGILAKALLISALKGYWIYSRKLCGEEASTKAFNGQGPGGGQMKRRRGVHSPGLVTGSSQAGQT